MMRHLLSFLAALALSTMPAFAMSDGDLRAAVERRFKGDRTGACVAAAVIDKGSTASAYVCADPKLQRQYDEHTDKVIALTLKQSGQVLRGERH